jgi:hypothetical protein
MTPFPPTRNASIGVALFDEPRTIIRAGFSRPAFATGFSRWNPGPNYS